MAAAYLYADGSGQIPGELRLLNAIDRFGAQAILGRPLGAGEIKRMSAAENIVHWYKEKTRASSWAEWAQANPKADAVLNYAMRLAQELDDEFRD